MSLRAALASLSVFTFAALCQAQDVPPLLPGEVPSTDCPNFYNPAAISAGGVTALFYSCADSARKASPELTDNVIEPYCTCTTDRIRKKHEVTRDLAKAMLTMNEVKACGDAVQSGTYTSAYRGTKTVQSLAKLTLGCAGVHKGKAVFCDCMVDAMVERPDTPFSLKDRAACEAAQAYRTSTKKHMTHRQFRAVLAQL